MGSGAVITGSIFLSRNDHNPATGYFATVGPDGIFHEHVLEGSRCCMLVSADGTWVQMEAKAPDGRATTALMHLDGSGYVELPLSDPTLNLGPGVWSPDGAQIAFEGYDEKQPERNGIYVGPAGAGVRTRITSAPGSLHDFPIAFSPDGSRILFERTCCSEKLGDLYVAKSDGSDLRRLSLEANTIWSDYWTGAPATWSPDGKQVAFAAFTTAGGGAGQSAIFVADVATFVAKRITDVANWTLTADWSPDGRRIVFNKQTAPGVGSIYVVHPDGTGLALIEESVLGACCATWSPDGTELLYAQGGDSRNLYVARADGSGSRPITTSAAEWSWYSWGP